jgi:DNA-binding beta-propeller fold protein YncE
MVLASCGTKTVGQPFVCYIPVNDAIVASMGDKILLVANGQTITTNIAYEKAVSSGNKLVFVRRGKAYDVTTDGQRLVLTELRDADGVAFYEGKIYFKNRNLLSVFTNDKNVGAFALADDFDELSIWKDTFFVTRKGNDTIVYGIKIPDSDILGERTVLSNAIDFEIATTAPTIYYILAASPQVMSFNLYSSDKAVVATMPTPIRKIRYFEAQRLLVMICDGTLAIQNLNTGSIEMGPVAAVDVAYDPNGNRMFVLNESGGTVLENISRLVEQTNMITTDNKFER